MKKITLLLLALGLSLASKGFAQLKFSEGVDYIKLAEPVQPMIAGQKEVLEIFWYGCPHCYSIKPYVERWVAEKKPQDVGFYYAPATLGGWRFAAQAHLTAEKLNLDMEKFHDDYFAAYYVDKNRGVLVKEGIFFAFLEKNFAVKEDDAKTAWNSFGVKKNLEGLDQKIRATGIEGTPSFLVNAQYVVDVTLAKSNERLFEIINFLLKTTEAAQ